MKCWSDWEWRGQGETPNRWHFTCRNWISFFLLPVGVLQKVARRGTEAATGQEQRSDRTSDPWIVDAATGILHSTVTFLKVVKFGIETQYWELKEVGRSHKKLSVQFTKDCHDEEFSASVEADVSGCLAIPASSCLTTPTAISSMKTEKSG